MLDQLLYRYLFFVQTHPIRPHTSLTILNITKITKPRAATNSPTMEKMQTELLA